MFRRFATSLFLVLIAISAWARTRPHYGGTLHVEVEGDPWTGPAGLARQFALDGLTHFGSDGAVEPGLATEWLSDDSAHRWEFRLRAGVQFQDGSPLNATSVVQSLNLSCNANCPWTSVRALGPSVIFTAESPMPNLPALLAEDRFLIALTVTAGGVTPANAIGTGPFRFSTLNNGVLTLVANESCWAGRPFLDSIEIRANRPIRDQWLDLNLGRADMVEVPPEDLRQAQQQRLAVKVSPPVELLALEIAETGALSNEILRASIAEAVDRAALFNVIFQKQGEITASLVPQEITGYSFLFSTDRDLNRAHELRGGLSVPPLTLGFEGDSALQLAAQRLALNLHEAGFDVQLIDSAHAAHVDLVVRRLPLTGGSPAAMMETAMRAAGEAASVSAQSPSALFRIEREFLDRKILIPLLDLPRAYAIGPRVRDLKLGADGIPDLAYVSLEDAP